MAPIKLCTRCGAELRPQNAEGFCTRCLLEGGLEEPLHNSQVPAPDQSGAFLTESDVRLSDGQPGSHRAFGDYELLDEIARGGMGVVYRARQTSLGRIVALKMILAGEFASKQIIQRFRGEVTAAALLQHPNIVAIYDVGIQESQHYFSMAYVEGQNLSQLVGTRPMPPAKAARYLKLIAEAIHYAHGQGILHRDLKPSNVLIDASDQPRITDFGLAKRLDGDASITVTGQVLGSPSFMPPEQAGSGHGKVGRPSDVYGLGAILYYLLTARPPFQAESLASIVAQVLKNEPVAPRTLNPSIPRDLETICLKCLSKESAKRYGTAGELAEELDRFLKDEPIQARPASQTEKVWRWCRRNPVVAGLGVALGLTILIALTVVTWQLRRVSHEELITRRNLYTADMNRVLQEWNEGNLQHAQELLAGHTPQPGKEDLRGFEWRYLMNLCQDESSVTFANLHFAGDRQGLALGADGQTVIAASGDTLQWLDCQQKRVVQTLTVGTTTVARLAMAMDQPGLVAYRTDRVHALSPTMEALLGAGLAPEFGISARGNEMDGAFALSWDGALLAASGPGGTVRIFDPKTGQPLGREFSLGEDNGALSLAFSPDGKYLACGAAGAQIHLLEVPAFRRVQALTNNTAFITCLAFNRTGTKLVSGGNDSHIRIWNFPECTLVADLLGHQGVISDLAFSADGLRLASGGSDHTVRLWTLDSPRAPILLHGHRDAVKSVLFSKDGNRLYTSSDDGTVKVWDLSSQKLLNILRHSGYAADVAFSPDGTLLAVADWCAQTAVLWQLPSQRQIAIVGEPSGYCTKVAFSSDGKLLATVGTNVQIWGIPSLKRIFAFPNLQWASVAFHPSRPLLAIGCDDLRFFDLQSGQPVKWLTDVPTNGVRRVAFSPNGNTIALGMEDGQVSLWDFLTSQRLALFHAHTNEVNALCFSRNGLLLASTGTDRRVVLYSLLQGTSTLLQGHRAGLSGLAFAPDNKTLVSASWDGTIRFWSVASHQVVLTLAHDGGSVGSVAFSADGNIMATSGNDATARLWHAAKSEPVAESRKATVKK